MICSWSRSPRSIRSSFRTLAALALAGVVVVAPGCTAEDAKSDGGPMPPRRVPTTGVIRLDGKPLAGAVVTFLPTDERGTLTVSDTKEDGSYDLTLQTFAGGTAPGPYKVGVSYMATPEGKTVPLSVRSALATPTELLAAKELLPPKYSNLGQTILSVTVPEAGGKFDFDLEGPLLSFPKTDTPATPAPAEKSAESKSQEEPAPKAQAAEPAQPNQDKGSETKPAPAAPGPEEKKGA